MSDLNGFCIIWWNILFFNSVFIGFSSSLPLPSKRQENINENCRFRATIGVPSSDKVGTVYSEKHTLFTQRPPHHRARPVSNVDRAPAEQSQPKGAKSPTVSRDYQSSHRLNSPKVGQSREQTKGERPYEYVRYALINLFNDIHSIY